MPLARGVLIKPLTRLKNLTGSGNTKKYKNREGDFNLDSKLSVQTN